MTRTLTAPATADRCAHGDRGDQQRQAAITLANQARTNQATVKRNLRNGTLSLTDVMLNPPHDLRNALLIDVIRWTIRTRSKTAALAVIGKHAVRDNINLMVSLGSASVMSRAWVAEHGYYMWRPSK
jgi:hypothetical protein